MGIFGRFLGSKGEPPAWVSFFSLGEYQRFEAALAAALGSRGLATDVRAGSIKTAAGAQLELRTLAQKCHAGASDAWPQLIAEHLARVLDPGDDALVEQIGASFEN